MQTPWLTLEEAATYLRISKSKLRQLVRDNEVRHTRLTPGNRSKFVFRHTWLDDFLLRDEPERIDQTSEKRGAE